MSIIIRDRTAFRLGNNVNLAEYFITDLQLIFPEAVVW